MALITRSIEMSFSLSRLRRTLRSMSIRASPLPGPGSGVTGCAVGVFGTAGAPAAATPGIAAVQLAELDLDPAGAELRVGKPDVPTIDIQRDAVVTGPDHPPLNGRHQPRGSRP